MIKTFSKIVEQGQIFGDEALFFKNYKRKQNAVAITEHAIILEMTQEPFDLLVKERLRRERADRAQFIFMHIPGMNKLYSFT